MKASTFMMNFFNTYVLKKANEQEPYYTETAYTGIKGKKIREAICQQYGAKVRTLQPMPEVPYVTAEDYMGNIESSEINDTRTWKEKDKEHGFWYMGKAGRSQYARERDCYKHQYLSFSPLNPSAIASFISIMGYVGTFALLILFIPLVAWSFWDDSQHTWLILWQEILSTLEILAVFAVIWKSFGWIATILPAKRGRYLNRRNGMLVIPQNFKKPLEIPFAELVPCLYHFRTHKLVYAHPPTQRSFTDIAGEKRVDAYLHAIFLEQFMDISKPLPDVPFLEIYRHLDPTTAEYDKATNRNPRFWRDKRKEEIAAIAKERQEAMEGIFGGGAFSI